MALPALSLEADVSQPLDVDLYASQETAGVNVEGFAAPVMVLGAHFARESRAWWTSVRAAEALVVYVGPVAEIIAPGLDKRFASVFSRTWVGLCGTASPQMATDPAARSRVSGHP
jgi:hypothetical protein